MDYDENCDAALPLDEVLKPDEALKRLLGDIDRTKYKVWALTNAYVNVRTQGGDGDWRRLGNRATADVWRGSAHQHAVRVLKLLDLADEFEGMLFDLLPYSEVADSLSPIGVVSCDYGAPDFSCKPEEGARLHPPHLHLPPSTN